MKTIFLILITVCFISCKDNSKTNKLSLIDSLRASASYYKPLVFEIRDTTILHQDIQFISSQGKYVLQTWVSNKNWQYPFTKYPNAQKDSHVQYFGELNNKTFYAPYLSEIIGNFDFIKIINPKNTKRDILI